MELNWPTLIAWALAWACLGYLVCLITRCNEED